MVLTCIRRHPYQVPWHGARRGNDLSSRPLTVERDQRCGKPEHPTDFLEYVPPKAHKLAHQGRPRQMQRNRKPKLTGRARGV